MAIGRSYPIIQDNSPLAINKAFKQAFDYIYQLQGGGAAASGEVDGGSALRATCTDDQELTLSQKDVPGCTLLLGAGLWQVTGIFAFELNASTGFGTGFLVADDAEFIDYPSFAISGTLGATTRNTVAQVWLIRVNSSVNARLLVHQGNSFGFAGFILAAHTSITAIKVG